ncbi:MAG: hypothetical protein LQ351_005435 [Letrouitia transgressa]|nr:MAG: hypothetical protein LQ351_005435 [Letrouitia transgressa]
MSSPNSTTSSTGAGGGGSSGRPSSTWQDRLQDHCARLRLPSPVFNIVSDRRGGRTAWSSTVAISGHHTIQARFWYDGQYVNNAKEDAAEVALQQLTGMGGRVGVGGGGGGGGGMGGRAPGAVGMGALGQF